MLTLSIQEWGRTAAATPSGTPISTESAVAVRVSCRVEGKTSRIIDVTSRCVWIDSPMSSVSAERRNRQYCT